ncbi:hypothetical protein [Massilia sp. PWRC2]|uniref:hypothetical protein n=1 Tax=Massilia sp. PWRC2 TaxID=2804626 RepID=UPI003CFA495B
MRSFTAMVLLAFTASVQAASATVSASGLLLDLGPHALGFRVVQQYDRARVYQTNTGLTSGQAATGERARPLQTLIWHPANKAHGKHLTYADDVRGKTKHRPSACWNGEKCNDAAS